MATLSLERLQAPSGGVNTDAAPDYVKPTQAQTLVNFLPGRDGKAVLRGPIRQGTFTQTLTDLQTPRTFWTYDDTALMKADAGSGAKYWKVALATQTITDVTASLAKFPFGSTGALPSTYARYGDSVFGAIDDAAGYGLGKWNGNTTIALQTNAPYNYVDLQVYAQRLFVLGGTVPGTTTPAVVGGRVLYWCDVPTTAGVFADLDLLASWKNDVSGLVEQIRYDADDTPVALAGCGRYMAILGTRSVNILTGSGSSSFAVRNLTKNWGCTSQASVVEVADGFYFMSDRGYCFCDGSTVTLVSADVSGYLAGARSSDWSATAMNNDWIALASYTGTQSWLFHTRSGAWAQVYWYGGQGVVGSVFRSLSYPLFYQHGFLLLADWVTNPNVYGLTSPGLDYNGSANACIAASWSTRVARLASPGDLATVQRVMLDYGLWVNQGESASADHSFVINAVSGSTSLGSQMVAPAQRNTESAHRKRAQFDLAAEADSVYLNVTLTPVSTPVGLYTAELYDAWVEFMPAQKRATI